MNNIKETLQKITTDDVLKVYSGKLGCMCGCLGRYYVTAERREEAGKKRGYTYEDRDVSRKMVNKVLRLLQADERTAIQDGYIVHIPRERMKDNERSYVVYLAAPVQVAGDLS